MTEKVSTTISSVNARLSAQSPAARTAAELLAEAKPYQVATRARFEIERIVCEQRVDPPSVHAPGLPADLDAIAMMCLRKEPERRYEGVGQLIEELSAELSIASAIRTISPELQAQLEADDENFPKVRARFRLRNPKK